MQQPCEKNLDLFEHRVGTTAKCALTTWALGLMTTTCSPVAVM
jgi:hypothetical protein